MSTEILHQMMDKLVSIESRMGGMETRMGGIESHVAGLDAKFDKLAEHQIKMDHKLDGACEQIARNTEILETAFLPLAATVDSLAATVGNLVTRGDLQETDIKLLKKLAVR